MCLALQSNKEQHRIQKSEKLFTLMKNIETPFIYLYTYLQLAIIVLEI